MAEFLRGVAGSNRDKGNAGKNETKHGVTDRESEEIFFNRPLVIARSAKDESEIRFAALGEKLWEPAFNGSVYPSRQQDSRDQRAADQQKRKETL